MLRWFQHRGCLDGSHNPTQQNTIEGAVEALERLKEQTGFAGLEFDVNWHEPEWRVCHDLPANEAQAVALPTLDEYLDAIFPILTQHDLSLQLEVKCMGDFEKLDNLIRKPSRDISSRVMVTSFERPVLRGVSTAQAHATQIKHYPLVLFVSRAADIDSTIAFCASELASSPKRLWLRVHCFEDKAPFDDFSGVEDKCRAAGLLPCVFSGIKKRHMPLIQAARDPEEPIVKCVDKIPSGL